MSQAILLQILYKGKIILPFTHPVRSRLPTVFKNKHNQKSHAHSCQMAGVRGFFPHSDTYLD